VLWEAACTYGTCHTTLSTLWDAARQTRANHPAAAAPDACLEVPQVSPQAPSEASTGRTATHQQQHGTAFNMHTSPISEPEDDSHTVASQTWLTLLLLPEFATLCYLNDLVKLASTSRVALDPAVEDHLALIQYQIWQERNWFEDWCVDRSAELDLAEFYEAEFPHLMGGPLCLSCGTESEEAYGKSGTRNIAEEAYRKAPQLSNGEVLRRLGINDNGGTYSEGVLDHLRYLRYLRHIENGSLQESEVADPEANTVEMISSDIAEANKVESKAERNGRAGDQSDNRCTIVQKSAAGVCGPVLQEMCDMIGYNDRAAPNLARYGSPLIGKLPCIADGAEHMETQARPRRMPPVSFLRQPGKGAEVEEEKAGKTRFIHHLEQQTMTCESGFEGNTSAAETPTLQRATITAGRTVKYMASREKSTEIGSLEPLQLDHFPHKLQSQAQAVNAASRMEGNQAPTTQPDMLQALEEKSIAAAEKDDPAWLAAIAIWLQVMGDLRCNQVIRRSVPVELSSGWILFFCKRGKQQHNRSGFYWGVPRKTTNGYDWTARFLADHEKQGRNGDGKHMMGMMSRNDSHQHFSRKAIPPLAEDEASGAVENHGKLTTYSWRRMLPTLGLERKSTKPQRLALGDWMDAEATSDEQS
jgi:hypothetical protein